LCQQTSPKRWFGNRTMTSFCDVTNSAHQIQMTILCRWMKPPPMKRLCVRHCWVHCARCTLQDNEHWSTEKTQILSRHVPQRRVSGGPAF